MNGNFSHDALAQLFALDAHPVIGVMGRSVQFLNPAARARYGDMILGASIRKLLPDYIALNQASTFLATAVVRACPMVVTVTTMPELRLYQLRDVQVSAQRPALLVPNSLLSMELGLASSFFSDRAAHEAETRFRHYAARLERTSDQLRRWIINATTLQELKNGTYQANEGVHDCGALLSTILDSVRPCLERKRLRLNFTKPDAPCPIRADPSLVETLVLNLLSNSIKSCADGAAINVMLTQGKRDLHLTIHDTGAGFAVETLTELFRAHSEDRMPRAEQMSTGYGLPLCFAIADHLGGGVLIEDGRRHGATVRVILPQRHTGGAILRASASGEQAHDPLAVRCGISDALTEEDYLDQTGTRARQPY